MIFIAEISVSSSVGHAGVAGHDRFSLLLRMIFSENRQPPRIKSGASFCGHG
jgi:hypothetical protein